MLALFKCKFATILLKISRLTYKSIKNGRKSQEVIRKLLKTTNLCSKQPQNDEYDEKNNQHVKTIKAFLRQFCVYSHSRS